MNSYYKNLVRTKFRSGTSVGELAADFGFSVEEVKKAINPNFGKEGVTTSAVKEVTHVPAELMKKIKQKNAGRKAAITRKRNKEAAIAKTTAGFRESFKRTPVEEPLSDIFFAPKKKLPAKTKVAATSTETEALFLVRSIINDFKRLEELMKK